MSSSAYPWDKLGQHKDFPPSLAGELQSWPGRAACGRRVHLVLVLSAAPLRRKNKPKKNRNQSHAFHLCHCTCTGRCKDKYLFLWAVLAGLGACWACRQDSAGGGGFRLPAQGSTGLLLIPCQAPHGSWGSSAAGGLCSSSESTPV